jgi:hypothetical protein
MTTTFPYILREDDISLFISGVPHSVAMKDDRFDLLVAAIRDPEDQDAKIVDILDRTKIAKAFVAGSADFKFVGNRITYRDWTVSGKLAKRVERMVKEGMSNKPLACFLDKAYRNPSSEVREHLYEFVEYGKLGITPDGNIVAYKRVSRKPNTKPTKAMVDAGFNFFLVDTHSGTFSNNIGDTPTMRRIDVNDNRDQTCMAGLHVCSFDYLSSFSGEVVIAVEVDPTDVVAIPRDYRNTKMRTCKYKVLNVIEYVGKEKPSEATKAKLTEKAVIDPVTIQKPTDAAKRWLVVQPNARGKDKIIARYSSREDAREHVRKGGAGLRVRDERELKS